MATEKELHEEKVGRLQKIVDYVLIVLKWWGICGNDWMLTGKYLKDDVRMFMQINSHSPIGHVVIWWGGDSLSVGYNRNTLKVEDTSRLTEDGKLTGDGGLYVSYSQIEKDPDFLFDLVQYLVLVPLWQTEPTPGSHS